MRKSHILATAAFALLGAAASSALATPIITPTSGPDGPPANTFSEVTSLITQGQSTYLSDSYTFPVGGAPDGDPFGTGVNSLNTVNSGGNLYAANSGDTHGSLTPYNGTNPAGCVATFILDTSVNTQGYDITSLISLTGYNAAILVGQAYTVAFSTASNPTSFTNYAIVSVGDLNQEVEVTITDTSGTLATNVAAVQFTFALDPSNSFTDVYRQMEVFGSPSVSAIPEPASLGLLSFGSLALLRRRRRLA